MTDGHPEIYKKKKEKLAENEIHPLRYSLSVQNKNASSARQDHFHWLLPEKR